MGLRTIRSGIGTYLGVDGQWRHGVLGDEVDVHDDDLERFDRLNPEAPEPSEAPAASVPEESPESGLRFSQADIDDAVKAAVDAKTAELHAAAFAAEESAATTDAATSSEAPAETRAPGRPRGRAK